MADTDLVAFADLEEALDPDGARMLVEAFLEDTGDLVARMTEAIAAGKLAELKTAAHALKGCCSSIMAAKTEGFANTMQHLAIDGKLEAAQMLLPDLASSYVATAASIKEYLG